MTSEIFSINIKGYWRDLNSPGLPNYSGVFFVYTARYDSKLDHLSLQDLIYVGEACNIRQRVNSHPKKSIWKKFLKPGSELCYSTAYVYGANCSRVKDAYVIKHQPLINSSRLLFSFIEPTKIIASGVTHLLQPIFTVRTRIPLDLSLN